MIESFKSFDQYFFITLQLKTLLYCKVNFLILHKIKNTTKVFDFFKFYYYYFLQI